MADHDSDSEEDLVSSYTHEELKTFVVELLKGFKVFKKKYKFLKNEVTSTKNTLQNVKLENEKLVTKCRSLLIICGVLGTVESTGGGSSGNKRSGFSMRHSKKNIEREVEELRSE